jgi:hypothetical protein
MWKTVYKILPVFVKYVEAEGVAPFAGKTNAMIIRIAKDYENDIGLLEHEMQHVKQFYKFPFHGLFYKYGRGYRLRCEVEAYKVQLKHTPLSVNHFAKFLSERYDLGISVEEAKKLLLD